MNENMMTDTELRADMTRTAFDHYVRRGMVTSALGNEENPIAGYVMPVEFEKKLVNGMNTIGVMRSLCTEVRTDTGRDVPIVTGHGQLEWIPEGTVAPLVRDTFDKIVLDSHLLAATIRVSGELLKDSAIDLKQYLADTFAERMAPMEDAAFVGGDGTDKPLGLLRQAAVGCETKNAGEVSVEDILNLIFSVPEKHRRNGTLLMNENTLLAPYRQCIAQETNLWLGKTNDGKDDTLFGYRIVRCNAMPDAQTGNTPVLFGDFKKAYINDCGNRGFKRLQELYAVNDQIGFMLAERVGIKLIVPDAIKGLKVA